MIKLIYLLTNFHNGEVNPSWKNINIWHKKKVIQVAEKGLVDGRGSLTMWTKVPLKQRTLINFCKSKVKMKLCLTLRVNFYMNTFGRYLSLISYNLGLHFWSKDSSFNIAIDRVKFIEFGNSRVEVKHSSICKLKIYILRNNFCDPMFFCFTKAITKWVLIVLTTILMTVVSRVMNQCNFTC